MVSFMEAPQVEHFLMHILSPVYRIVEDDTIRDPQMGLWYPTLCAVRQRLSYLQMSSRLWPSSCRTLYKSRSARRSSLTCTIPSARRFWRSGATAGLLAWFRYDYNSVHLSGVLITSRRRPRILQLRQRESTTGTSQRRRAASGRMRCTCEQSVLGSRTTAYSYDRQSKGRVKRRRAD